MTRIVFMAAIAAVLITGTGVWADSSVSLNDFAQIHQIEITFHQAAATQDVDLMMSLFANNATLTAGGKTYLGKDQIRAYFSRVAKPFQPGNHWAAYTPAYKIRLSVNGNKATLYFECLYVDVATGQIKAHTNSDDTLVRSAGHWLIQTMKAGKVKGF
jgi:hypothetical protein